MPSSKLPFLRYMAYDRLLRNKQHPYPTKEYLLTQLEEEFGVSSPSTIEKDLNALRLEFDAPIAYSKRHKGYHYTDTSFQLFSVNLSVKQQEALQFVEEFLQGFRHVPVFREFTDAVEKVLDGLKLTRDASERESYTGPTEAILQVSHSGYIPSSNKLSQLIEFITNKKAVALEYKKHSADKPDNYLLHPYLIKEFRNLWYVIGYVEGKGIRTFGIDRIIDVYPLNKQAFISKEDSKFDADAFFENCYGITSGEAPAEIELLVVPTLAPYLKAAPLHNSQRIIAETSQGVHLQLRLIINPELRSLLLSYGSNIEVLSPAALRASLAKVHQKALATYQLAE